MLEPLIQQIKIPKQLFVNSLSGINRMSPLLPQRAIVDRLCPKRRKCLQDFSGPVDHIAKRLIRVTERKPRIEPDHRGGFDDQEGGLILVPDELMNSSSDGIRVDMNDIDDRDRWRLRIFLKNVRSLESSGLSLVLDLTAFLCREAQRERQLVRRQLIKLLRAKEPI